MPKRDIAYMAGRRDEIITAARDILRRKGLAGLSTTEICRVAKISMGALYTHFASKDEIIRALAERTTRELSALYDFRTAGEMRKRLVRRAADTVRPENAQGFRVDLELLSAGLADPELMNIWQSFRDSRHLVNAIRRLVQAGELRSGLDAEAAAAAIESVLIGLGFLHALGGRKPFHPAKAMGVLVDGMMAETKRRA